MKYSANSTALSQANAVFVAVFEDGTLSPSAQQLDTQNKISDLIKSGDISGKIDEITAFRRQNQHIIVVGAGKPGEINERQFKQISQKAFQAL